MNTTSDVPPLRVVGRIAYRILLVAFLLAILATVVLMVRDSDSLVLGFVAIGAAGLLLAGLPTVLFLLYAWRREPPDVPRLVRRSIYASSGTLAVIGVLYAWASLTGDDKAPVAALFGAVVAMIGIAAIVLLWRFTAPAAPVAQFAYTRFSGVGLVCFVLIAVITPKFACGCGTKGAAYKAEVKSDLRNLALAQDAFFADSMRYGFNRDLGEGFRASSGDSIVIQYADAKGFRALGWHMNLPDTRCGIWVGVAPADGMHGARPGEPTCWKQP